MEIPNEYQKPIIRVDSKVIDLYRKFKIDMLKEYRMDKNTFSPEEELNNVERKIKSVKEITFGKDAPYCGQELLELLSGFEGLNDIEIQVRINEYLAKLTGSEMAFLILPSAEKLTPFVNVLGSTPSTKRMAFLIDEMMFPEHYYFKLSIFTRYLSDENRWKINRRGKIETKSFIAVPIFPKPESEKALYLMALVNRHLKNSNSSKVQLSSSMKDDKSPYANSAIEFSSSDEMLVHNVMQYLSVVIQNIVCTPSQDSITMKLHECFTICKELLVIKEQRVEMLNMLMIKSLDLLKARGCGLFIPMNNTFKGTLFYKIEKEIQITSLSIPIDFSTSGHVYKNKELININTSVGPKIFQEINVMDRWVTQHVMSIPVKKDSNDVVAIIEIYNKLGISSGFDKYDEVIAGFLSNICLFCIVLN